VCSSRCGRLKPKQSKVPFSTQLAFATTTATATSTTTATAKQHSEPGGDNFFPHFLQMFFSPQMFHHFVAISICFNGRCLSNSFLICTLFWPTPVMII